MRIPDDLHYRESHEWIRLEDNGTVRVGITDFAQDALGDIVYVELPEAGRELTVGESFAEVESTKSVSDVYAPVAGTVEAVNEALGEAPERVNQDPYGAGWFIVIRPSEELSLVGLLDAAGYSALTD